MNRCENFALENLPWPLNWQALLIMSDILGIRKNVCRNVSRLGSRVMSRRKENGMWKRSSIKKKKTLEIKKNDQTCLFRFDDTIFLMFSYQNNKEAFAAIYSRKP